MISRLLCYVEGRFDASVMSHPAPKTLLSLATEICFSMASNLHYSFYGTQARLTSHWHSPNLLQYCNEPNLGQAVRVSWIPREEVLVLSKSVP